MKYFTGSVLAAVMALGCTQCDRVMAHEFWLDPVDFTPKAGARVPIVHRTGINFLGDSYPYIRSWSKRFSVIDARGERAIKAVEGDDPAAEASVPNAGLAIVVFQRAPDTLVHPTFERFAEVVGIEGLEHIAVQHQASGLPLVNIRENFSRYAKALLKVGNGKGSDRVVGLPLELVIEADPYELARDAMLPVRVLLEGKPAQNVLVKAFNRADQQSPRQARTDSDGRVLLQGVPPGEVLLSAVVMMRAAPAATAEWTSLWASATFKRP